MFVWKKYVYEVYKERSFSKAASESVHQSEPSLSARIKKIEEIIGEPLLTEVQHRSNLQRSEKYILRAAEGRSPRSNSG